MMKISVIVASALGFAFTGSSLAFNVEEERQQKMRLAYNSVPHNNVQAVRKVHRPKRRVAFDTVDRTNASSVRDRSRHRSAAKHRGSSRGFPSKISPPGVRVFIFSPRRRAWAAYLPSGRLVGTGRASGGSSWCKDIGRSCRTPRGTFRVRSLGGVGCKSSQYPRPRGGAKMPYCMHYSKYYAVHGSYHVPNYNASHGCIRVTPRAAKWLRYNFMKIGTRVIVTSY